MAWQFKDINMRDINLEERTKGKYKELYDRIFSLNVGKGFEIETETNNEAANIRKSVSAMLKRRGMSDKYVAINRLNKFQCGRTK